MNVVSSLTDAARLCFFMRSFTRTCRRRFARLGWILALCAGGVVAGPGLSQAGETEAQETIELRIAAMPGPLDTGAGAQAMRQVIREFQDQYPHYRLTRFHMAAIRDEGGMDEGPLRAIVSGMPPHAIYVNFRQSSSYINHGFLAPLDVLLARVLSDNPRVREADAHGGWLEDPEPWEIEAALQKIRARVIDPAWPVVYRKADTDRAGVPEGKHVWALPTSNLVQALMYRRDVFDAAGLDPDRPPQTLDELFEYAKRIRSTPGYYGVMFSTGVNVSYSMINVLNAFGVQLVEQDDEGVWRAAFNTREAAEAIYFILRLVREPIEVDGETLTGVAFAPMGGGQEMGMKWRQGEIGMRFSDFSFEQSINPALEAIAPIPSVEGAGTIAGQVNCRMLGVFSDIEPERQLGVMRYIWFLTGPRAREIRTRTMVNHGMGRFADPQDLEEFGYDDVLREVPGDWLQTLRFSFQHGIPEPYGRNTQQIYEYSSGPINWAIRNPALLDLPKEEALNRILARLDEAAERTDRFMLGELTPEEWRRRRLAGAALLVLIITIFVTAISWVWRGFTREEKALGVRPSWRFFLPAYTFIFPGVALVLFVSYLPLVLGIPIALFDYQLVLQSAWVGLDNFATVLYDPRFWKSLTRTFYYVLLVIGIGFWPPILVAVLLDEVPTQGLKYTFRTIFYLPTIVSGIIMVFLWRQLYDPSETGFLNQLILTFNRLGPFSATFVRFLLLGFWLSLIGVVLTAAVKLNELSRPVRAAITLFGLALVAVTLHPLWSAYVGPDPLIIEAQGLDPAVVTGWGGLRSFLAGFLGTFDLRPLGWIEDPGLAMISVVIPMVWASAGPGCIIYLAALKTVPEELVEAATIDGANLLQKLSYITLPRIKFLILIQLLSAVVSAFRGGANFILVMTGGGPDGATRTLGLDIFERAWMELRFSEGAAMGWVLGAVVVTMTCYQLRRMSQATFRSAATDEAKL